MDIKNVRKSTGLSQLKLAHLAKISRFRLYMAESGYLKLTDAERVKIKKVLEDKKNEKSN